MQMQDFANPHRELYGTGMLRSAWRRRSAERVCAQRTPPTHRVALLATALLTFVFAPSARSDDETPHRLGDHPAVVVQRLHRDAGYDYASKFYPHPAWLYLDARAAHDPAGREPQNRAPQLTRLAIDCEQRVHCPAGVLSRR